MHNETSSRYQVGKSRVTVGRFTYGHENLTIREWGEGANLDIGSFCSLASCIQVFLGGNHRTDWISTYPFGHIFTEELGGVNIKGHPATKGDIVVGNDVWIGHGATIMPGIKIGSGSVIAANATVIKDVEPYEIVGGNPGKTIKKRFTSQIIDLLLHLAWWDLPQNTIKEIAPILCHEPSEEEIRMLLLKHRE